MFNRIGMAAVPMWLKRLRIPGYKSGGFVRPKSGDDGLVPVVFNIPNVGKVPAKATRSVTEELTRALKIEALMRGGR
jgi:hypothetical protein